MVCMLYHNIVIENIWNVLHLVYDLDIYNVKGIILKHWMMVMDRAHAISTVLQMRIYFAGTWFPYEAISQGVESIIQYTPEVESIQYIILAMPWDTEDFVN
jgi:hypothetical protein